METELYKDIAKRRIRSTFKLSFTNPEEAWKRSFWTLSGLLSVAMYDPNITGQDYENLSCELHNYLEHVYNRESGKEHRNDG